VSSDCGTDGQQRCIDYSHRAGAYSAWRRPNVQLSGRPINSGGTDGMNWPAMIARCSSSWPLPALKASHALSGSKKTPIGLAANFREES
jgi:hypothetical protein